VLGSDGKRVHIAHEVLLDDGTLVATGEQLLLHVDSAAGRAGPMPDVLRARVAEVARAHAVLDVPDWVGRVIRIPREARAWTSS
jgi:carnitine 3-dehydrogenase